jgi:uncharacterized protein
MFLDLNGLALRPGGRYERNYIVDVAPVTLGGTRYDVLLSDGVDVVVDRVAGGFLVNVSARVRLYGPCARCLEEVVLEVQADQQEFAPTAKGGWEETELSAFIKDVVVDVSGLVREAVVLALPSQALCSPSCKGLCPQCGKDLNQGPCECVDNEVDERWSKLSELKFDDEAGA